MSFSYKNVTASGDGSAKDPVADFASLPSSGNTDGDLRVALDTHTLYVWNAGTTSWDTVTGSSTNSFTTFAVPAGTNPIADSSSDTLNLTSSDSSLSITGNSVTDTIDFVLPSTIPGNKTFSGTLSIGDLQILPTQTALALDNQASAANLFSYPATNEAAIIDMLITRNGQKGITSMTVVTNGTTAEEFHMFLEQSVLGLTFSTTISAGNVVVQYTSTNTGFNANIKYNVRRWM